MRRGWNQCGHAVMVAAAAVVGTNDQEASVLTLGARIGLQGCCGKTGYLGQITLQTAKHLMVARSLFYGNKGMHVGKCRPTQGEHLGSSIELHGAATKGYHAVI